MKSQIRERKLTGRVVSSQPKISKGRPFQESWEIVADAGKD